MNSIEFLRGKGLLNSDKTKFTIILDDGREFDLVDLLDEYKSGEPIALVLLKQRFNFIMADLMDDGFDESLSKLKHDLIVFFENHPTFDTPENRRYFQITTSLKAQ